MFNLIILVQHIDILERYLFKLQIVLAAPTPKMIS